MAKATANFEGFNNGTHYAEVWRGAPRGGCWLWTVRTVSGECIAHGDATTREQARAAAEAAL